MRFKIAFIGAGSVVFTRRILSDLLTVPELRDIEVAFMDVNEHYLDIIAKLCRKDIESNGLDVKITTTTDRKKALEGAKYVVNCARIGGLEGLRLDTEIPMKYGVGQCVADTLSAGGIMYGQRGVPFMLDLCRDIKEVARDDVFLLNYANPNAMMTWTAINYANVPATGLCHGVQGGHNLIAKALGLPKEEVDIICAGINHQTWYVRIEHNGEDLTGKLLEAMEKDPEISSQEPVRIDMLRNFGYFSTESNGHLSEYLPWYRKNEEEIAKWVGTRDAFSAGKTKAYYDKCLERRNEYEENFDKWLAEPSSEFTPENRTHEHGSFIIEAMETGRVYRGHFNVVNGGTITNLPDDAVIEVPGYVDKLGMHIPKVGDLPLGCAAVCSASISVQRLAVKAAITGDVNLLRQAMLLDPLVGAVCTTPQVRAMVDEMLVANKKWLPQYKDAIEAIEKR